MRRAILPAHKVCLTVECSWIQAELSQLLENHKKIMGRVKREFKDEQFFNPIGFLLSLNWKIKPKVHFLFRCNSRVTTCFQTYSCRSIWTLYSKTSQFKKITKFKQTYLKKLSKNRSLNEFPSITLHYIV